MIYSVQRAEQARFPKTLTASARTIAVHGRGRHEKLALTNTFVPGQRWERPSLPNLCHTFDCGKGCL